MVSVQSTRTTYVRKLKRRGGWNRSKKRKNSLGFRKRCSASVPIQFENYDVKVWKSVVVPNAPLTMQRHEHPRVIIALNDGTMKIVEQNGPSEQRVWETGKAHWLPSNPPNTLHADVNAGNKPIEVMVVELKNEN